MVHISPLQLVRGVSRVYAFATIQKTLTYASVRLGGSCESSERRASHQMLQGGGYRGVVTETYSEDRMLIGDTHKMSRETSDDTDVRYNICTSQGERVTRVISRECGAKLTDNIRVGGRVVSTDAGEGGCDEGCARHGTYRAICVFDTLYSVSQMQGSRIREWDECGGLDWKYTRVRVGATDWGHDTCHM
ncbi:hypothetical protein Tco_1226003 [Tanacetum coccineum]